MGMDITYGVVWHQIGQDSSPWEGQLCTKSHEESNRKPTHFIIP